jgi:hypothetical protein
MAAAIGLRDDFDGTVLRRHAKVTKDAAQERRLLALAEIYDGGSRSNGARIPARRSCMAAWGQGHQGASRHTRGVRLAGE